MPVHCLDRWLNLFHGAMTLFHNRMNEKIPESNYLVSKLSSIGLQDRELRVLRHGLPSPTTHCVGGLHRFYPGGRAIAFEIELNQVWHEPWLPLTSG